MEMLTMRIQKKPIPGLLMNLFFLKEGKKVAALTYYYINIDEITHQK